LFIGAGSVPLFNEVVDFSLEDFAFKNLLDEFHVALLSYINLPAFNSLFYKLTTGSINRAEVVSASVEHFDLPMQGVPRIKTGTVIISPNLLAPYGLPYLKTVEVARLGTGLTWHTR
jgi:hypothetical protein